MAGSSKSKRASFQSYKADMRSLLSRIKDNDWPHFIVISGKSDYLAQRTLKKISKAWQAAYDSSPRRRDAAQTTHDDLVAAAGQRSMFDDRDFYIISRLQNAKVVNDWLKAQSGEFANVVCLVTAPQAATPTLRKQIERLGGLEVECVEPWPEEWGELVQAISRDAGVQLSPASSRFLLESLGTDAVKMEQECFKLAFAFHGNERPLEPEDIAPHLGAVRADHAFKLTDHLLNHDYGKAHILVADLLERGESPLAILGLLSRHCRNALILKEKRQVDRAAAGRLRLPFPILKRYNQYASHVNTRAMSRALNQCQRADTQLKSSGSDGSLVLATVIEELRTPTH